jgi:hypothetical protein
MPIERTMTALQATHSGDGAVVMAPLSAGAGKNRVAGIPSGVLVDLGAGVTSADITITDENGLTIFSRTGITADTTYPFADMSSSGALGQLTSTLANVAGGTAVIVTIYIRQ